MHLAGVSFTWLQLAMIGSSFLLMLCLYWFINRTRLGIAIKATSTDPFMAQLLGINVDTVISVTFMIGSFLAACAGVMIGLYYGSINFTLGYLGGMKAFTAAVLGGIGNVAGAMAGGLLLGSHRSAGGRLLLHRIQGCLRILHPDRGADLPPGRSAGKEALMSGARVTGTLLYYLGIMLVCVAVPQGRT